MQDETKTLPKIFIGDFETLMDYFGEMSDTFAIIKDAFVLYFDESDVEKSFIEMKVGDKMIFDQNHGIIEIIEKAENPVVMTKNYAKSQYYGDQKVQIGKVMISVSRK